MASPAGQTVGGYRILEQNGGVGLAPCHNLEPVVPPGLREELEQVREGTIAGEIRTQP